MSYEALLTQVFAAITIVVLLSLLIMMVKNRKRRRRRRRRIQRRRAAPINSYYYCAHCAVRALHGPRTRAAWKAGSRRFFCDDCKTLQQNEAQRETEEEEVLSAPRPPAPSGRLV